MVLAHQQPNSIFLLSFFSVDMLAKDGFKEECEAAELAAVCRDPPGAEWAGGGHGRPSGSVEMSRHDGSRCSTLVSCR